MRAVKRLEEAAREARDPVELSVSFQQQAAVLHEYGELREATGCIDKSIAISRRDAARNPRGILHDLNLKASILSEMGETRKAFNYYLDAYRYAVPARDIEGEYMLLSNLKLLVLQSSILKDELKAKHRRLLTKLEHAGRGLAEFIRPVERFRLDTTAIVEDGLTEENILEEVRRLEQLEISGAQIHPLMIADRYVNLAQKHLETGSYTKGLAVLRKAFAIYQKRDVLGGIVRCRLIMAIVAYDLGRIPAALRHIDAAMAHLAGRYPNGSILGSIHHLRALCALSTGDYASALHDLKRMERCKMRAMEDSELLLCRYTTAQVLRQKGDIAKARRILQELMEAYRRRKDTIGLADVSFQLGLSYQNTKNHAEATRRFRDAERFYRKGTVPLGAWRSAVNAGVNLFRAGKPKQARKMFERAAASIPEGAQPHETEFLESWLISFPENVRRSGSGKPIGISG
jgi:tetratricopeptide (TPR) repeat protein